MGKNAGCGLVVGVLSGADTAEQLIAVGADVVVDNVTVLGMKSNEMKRRRIGNTRSNTVPLDSCLSLLFIKNY